LLDDSAEDERSWRRYLTTSTSTHLPRVDPQAPAALFYTSGTTGQPKGVPLSHDNLVFQLNVLLATDLVTRHDRLLLPLPLHHVYPFVIGMLTPLALGLPIVMPYTLTGQQLRRALRDGEVTAIIGVPRLYQALLAAIEVQTTSRGRVVTGLWRYTRRLSTALRSHFGWRVGNVLLRPLHQQFGPQLRLLASGGAALDPELARQLEGMGWQIAQGYGLTETSPLLTITMPRKSQTGSVGRPLPGVQIRIDTASSADTPDGSEAPPADSSQPRGEILAKGPNVFAGYHNLPEQTQAVFTDDGWFRTGDLGFLDPEGHLYVLGRLSTMIVTTSGENIQPEDVEEVYLSSPYIREIGVLTQSDRIVAVIVPELHACRQHGDRDLDQIIRDAVTEQAAHVPSYRRIADYAITREALPRTHLGKLRRHLLAERYERAKTETDGAPEASPEPRTIDAMSTEDQALLRDAAAKQTWDWLARRYTDQHVTPDTRLQLDLGIDSLEWLNLTLEIRQHAGIDLDEEAVSRIDTVRELLQEVTESPELAADHARLSPLEHPETVLDERQQRWLAPLGASLTAMAKCYYRLNQTLARHLFHVRVQGLDHLPEHEPFILTPNHLSYLDPFVLAACLDFDRLHRTYWGGWTGVAFTNPLSRFFSRLAQVVPIDANRAVLSSLAFGAAVLKRRQNLIWFPEGHRSESGDLQPFQPGIGMLLDHFQIPVVPVSIRGTYEAMPPGAVRPRRRHVSILIGDPLDPKTLVNQGQGDQRHERIVQALHDHMAQLGRIHQTL
jgi:long-chain acyl-CoA synthetase